MSRHFVDVDGKALLHAAEVAGDGRCGGEAEGIRLRGRQVHRVVDETAGQINGVSSEKLSNRVPFVLILILILISPLCS